jgi:hypothetical protein
MADAQDVTEAKERVAALRRQVKAEQAARAAAADESQADHLMAALSEEERSLQRQLEEVRSVQMPGADPNAPVVPESPVEGAVNVEGDSGRADPLAEGGAFTETVDSRGNLVRTPVAVASDQSDPNVQTVPDSEGVPAEKRDDEAEGMREADPPPPDVPDDATMTSRKPRR